MLQLTINLFPLKAHCYFFIYRFQIPCSSLAQMQYALARILQQASLALATLVNIIWQLRFCHSFILIFLMCASSCYFQVLGEYIKCFTSSISFTFHWHRINSIATIYLTLNSTFRSIFQFAVVYLLQSKPWGLLSLQKHSTKMHTAQNSLLPLNRRAVQHCDVLKCSFIPVTICSLYINFKTASFKQTTVRYLKNP